MEDGTPIESKMVTRRIEGAQRKVEERHFEARKNLLEYDEVMDFQRKSVYGYRQRILEGANTKELVGEMLEEQIDLHLKEFLQKDIGPASFAAWAGSRLACELDAKDFRSMTYTQAEEFAIDTARRLAETQVLDAIDENLPDTDDETEWNWKALASFAESRWKLGITDTDLKKVGRDKIDVFLIERARQFIDGVDLSEGAVFLEQDYNLKTVVAWAYNKFGIVIDPETIRKMEFPQIREYIAKLTWQRYAEKEIDLSLSIALREATVHDSTGDRFDRERLVAWAVSRFGAALTLDDIKGEQHDGIVKIVSERCHAGHQRQVQQREELRAAAVACLRAAGFDPDQFHKEVELLMKTGGGRAGAGSRFAARSIARTPMRYSGKYASQRHLVSQTVSGPRLTPHQPELIALCDEVNKICDTSLAPDVVATWEPQELEDRVIALWEDRYHPEMRYMERSLILQVLDSIWKDHLLVMEQLRASVGLRGYAQVDPKVEYKREGMKLFTTMWNTVFERVSDLVFRMEAVEQGTVERSSTWRESAATHASAESGFAGLVREQQSASEKTATQQDPAPQRLEPFRRTDPKVGRNDPCPCGSGKKYKHCHLKQQ
ncbi:MAG: SEC-C metal-binding domain-containing protein [Thermoguttaceae bacterium]